MKSKVNIGSSSLILIFIILCLSVFGLLSLTSARSDLSLAQKNAQAVQGFYEADSQGETFVQMVDQALQESQDEAQLKMALGAYYQAGSDGAASMAVTDISMERGQVLHIELALEPEKKRYEVKTWKVFNAEEYEIDDSMPVWTGSES